MRGPLILHQTVEYRENEPVLIRTAIKEGANHTYVKNSHWHDELEIVYLLSGHSEIDIEGEHISADPGRLVVVNCECIHRFCIDTAGTDGTAALVLFVPKVFLEEQFPDYKSLWFLNDKTTARPEIRQIMEHLSEYRSGKEDPPQQGLYLRGLILLLLHYMCEEGTGKRPTYIRQDGGSETLKSILGYIDDHYYEPISQADIAARFYFTPQYFARYFKQRTGTTFTEHLTGRRIHQARKDLLGTDKLIGDIALDNGFPDERSFNNAFKKMYCLTPMQYRKNVARGSR